MPGAELLPLAYGLLLIGGCTLVVFVIFGGREREPDEPPSLHRRKPDV